MTITTDRRAPGARSGLRAGARLLYAIGAPMLFLFGGAGTWNWPAAWVYMLVLAGGIAAAIVVFTRFQPGLAHERASHAGDGTWWDRTLLLVVGVLGPAAVQIVSGLDRRFGWSLPPPVAAEAAAAAVFAAAAGITAWAMAVNAFFSSVIRIQADRGHTVVDRGPYRVLRHPGYAAMIAATIAVPVLLGSAWALVPSALIVAAFLSRTVREDRVLRAELPGYRDYAGRVRYRLIPGVW